ncbi:MAG TPA: hypothetical protein VKX45_17265 [Bryobacteraceae bacterium]|nr:hypothetical protein [Bryobacteraceae bacterium]
MQLASGAITMDFDPSVFGNFERAAVLSAAGDATGYAHLGIVGVQGSGTHVDAQFWSSSGSIGQLPEAPVFVVSIPVLASARLGAASMISVDPSGNPENSIFGMNLGAIPSEFTLDSAGKLPAMLNGTQVLINGQPAPLLYTSASQINAIVPYEIGQSGTATVQVVSGNLQVGHLGSSP